MEHTRQDKSMLVFMNGVYEVPTKNLWNLCSSRKVSLFPCLIPKNHVNSNNPLTGNCRTLKSLGNDYRTFLECYKESKKDVNTCNNSIHSPR